jgi:lipocalin
MLVSGDCDVGTQGLNHVNFTKALDTWYVLLHTPNDFENNFKCVVATYGPLVENISLITLEAFDISENSNVTIFGNGTNWTNISLVEVFQVPTIWSGQYYVIATDYDHYIILKMCSFQTNQLYVYVAYRSRNPDDTTVNNAKKELQKNNIDFGQLVDWPANHCQQSESSTEGGSDA